MGSEWKGPGPATRLRTRYFVLAIETDSSRTPATSPHSAMSSALMIIDVQQALCVGQYAMFEADRVIARINDMSRRARDAGVPVVVVQHESDAGQDLEYGTDGWQLATGLVTHESDIFVRKKASDAFHQTELDAVLHAHDVQALIVCGMQSDFCVESTTRRALALGYPVVLVSDAHTTMDNGVLTAPQIIAHHNATLSHIDSYGAARVTLEPASSALGQP